MRPVTKLWKNSERSSKIYTKQRFIRKHADTRQRSEEKLVTYFRIRWGDGTRLFRVEDSRAYRDAEQREAMYFLGRPLDPSTGEWATTRQKIYAPDVVNWNAKW